MICGKHYIDGQWVASSDTFVSHSLTGKANSFSIGSAIEVDQAVQAAEKAFEKFAHSTREDRALFLIEISTQIKARIADIVAIAMDETGLPEARLIGECARTTGQLELFAETIRDGHYLDRRHDPALPERSPLPRPDLKLIQRPVGPVAVFGASNFPLAFSVAGGDTASALAAGCPVVVKGHSAHPGTSEMVAKAIATAIEICGLPTGVFSLLQGDNRELGTSLVKHPLVSAVGFTGSLRGGRALYDLCAARPNPIPFFGELGAVNPVFVLPNANVQQAGELGSAWANSVTMGVGQFCTNPGVVFALDTPELDEFIDAALIVMENFSSQNMLTEGMAKAYDAACQKVSSFEGVEVKLQTGNSSRKVGAQLYTTTGRYWQAEPEIHDEVFGPCGIIVRVQDEGELIDIARNLVGQLTCTLHLGEEDALLAKALMPILERKAGRILVNGFPTGVEVCDSMVHGGPYPASTNFGATSVGTMSIRRFLRPVCFQNMPSELLPREVFD